MHRAITTSTTRRAEYNNGVRLNNDRGTEKKKLMTHHTSVKKLQVDKLIYLRFPPKPLICALARPAACKAGLPFSIQHTEVHTIVRITLAFCSDCLTRTIVCALLNIRVPEYHCATPLDSKNLAAENTIDCHADSGASDVRPSLNS